MRKNSLTALSAILLTIFVGTVSIYAQYEDSLCEYTWNSNVNNCPNILTCLWPEEWDDTTVQVSANVTRISKDSLKLCFADLNIVKPADIIYIMDLSGSMLEDFNPPGDPLKVRDDAIEAGFTYQIDHFQESKAGYLGFGSNVVQSHLLPPVNVFTGQPQLAAMVAILRNYVETQQSAGSTNYKDALAQAIEWLQNPLLCPHEDKAIIFISDGNPSPTSNAQTPAQVSYLATNNIPVHGIFLSNTGMGQYLFDLADSTGGTATLVPTTDVDTLSTVVENIIQTLIKDFTFKTLSLTNTTTNTTATAINCVCIDDTLTWVTTLDKAIPLNPGINAILFEAEFGVVGDTTTEVLSFMFNINVNGPYTSECYFCRYKSTLEVLDNNVPTDTLTWENTDYTIKLSYSGFDTLDMVDIAVQTQKGDYEVITIDNWYIQGDAFIFEKTVPFAVSLSTIPPNPNNGITEANYEDLITLRWEHPYDERDTATDTVKVIPPPNNIKIYDRPGDPATLPDSSLYSTSPQTDTVTAGTFAELYAKVFANVKWLEDYENNPELYKYFTWSCVNAATGVEDPSIGILTYDDSCAHNSFFPIKAYHSVDITASLDVGAGPIKETIRLYIKPGKPKQLVIEATNDSTQTDLNNPVPWDPIVMTKSVNTLTAYAILRDSLGNWVGPATQAMWTSDSAAVVTVDAGPGDAGVIHKGVLDSGQTKIHATQSGLKGTSTVITLEYDIVALRIVRVLQINDTLYDTSDIEQLTMNTNEDTTLVSIGKRSDTKDWVPVAAKWAIDPAATEQNPPVAAPSWTFSPSMPATGIIYAAFVGFSDIVDFIFTPGPPIKVLFEIVTPDSLLIAGEPINGVVTIFNEDGPVPGIWKYPGDPGGVNAAMYYDTLDNGGLSYIPFATTEEDIDSLNLIATIVQSFYNGVDTLVFVLYYAPWEKYPHKLTVNLDGLLASTDEFILKPGPLDIINLIIKNDTITTGDTLYLTTTDSSFMIIARGFDKFGNYLKFEPYTWHNDSTLFDYNLSAQSDQIYFDPTLATESQQGYVVVTSVDHPDIFNHVYIIFTGPLPTLRRAITRDYNGNGFLDAIELSFDKSFNIVDYNPDYISVHKIKTDVQSDFTVNSITQVPFSSGKKFLLNLSEEGKKLGEDDPETAWKPFVTIDASALACINEIKQFPCEDGAGPVVWTVVKKVIDVADRTKDVVTVTLSEYFFNYNGSAFLSAYPKPPTALYVWEWTEMGGTIDTIRIDSILAGIQQFNDQLNDWTVFNMTNAKNLTCNHFVNLDFINRFVADNAGNIPNDNNQKVRVKVVGAVIGIITVGPIPIIPSLNTFNEFNSDIDGLEYIDINTVYNLIKTQNGTVITVEIMGEMTSAQVNLMVFDAVGNLAFEQYNSNFLETCPPHLTEALKNGERVQLCFYWSGVTNRGMKTAPGVYRMVVFVIPDKGERKNFSKTVAVGR